MKTYVSITSKSGSKKYEFSPNFERNLKLIIATILFIFILLVSTLVYISVQNKTLSNKLLKARYDNRDLVTLLSEQSQNNTKTSDTDEEMSSLELILALEKNTLKEQPRTVNLSLNKDMEKIFLSSIPNGLPIELRGVTSKFGERIHPISKNKRFHHGIDLRASEGTPTYAPADGFVKYSAMSNTGYGYLVIISHNYGFETRFAHMLNKDVVRVGQRVKKGDLIGYTGNTGYSTGPHLHYEVRFLDHTLDPINFMSFENIFYDERKVPWQAITGAMAEY